MRDAQTFQARHDVALQVSVVALEQANGAAEDDPISAHQWRLILETGRRIVARMNLRIADLAVAEARHEG